MLLVHILRDGVILVPPFPVKKIPSLIRAQAVTRADYYWHEGMSEWVSVGARWPEGVNFIEDDEPAVAPPSADSLIESDLSAATSARRPQAANRWERPSLLRDSKRRYHETLVPWSRSESVPQAS